MTLVRQYRLYGVMALLVMFVTMDSACSMPSPWVNSYPPHVNCRTTMGAEVDGCGQLCDSGFWDSATADDVRAEIDGGVNLEKTDADGYSPLHLAARCLGDPEVMAVLLDAGADPNREGPMDVTPLHLAAGFADRAIVELLIDAGADLEAKSWRRDYTPLHFAASEDNPEALRVLLERGALPDAPAAGGRTPLHVALGEQASLATVAALLDSGASVRWAGLSGQNPLHIAAINNAPPEVIYLLVSRGADANAKNKLEETPLESAIRHRSSAPTIRALFDVQIGATGSVDARDSHGNTALHRAMNKTHPPSVIRLLERGADPNARDLAGRTPLHLIATHGRDFEYSTEPELRIIAALVRHGANLESTDIKGWTALHWAAHKGGKRVIAMLLAHGADASALTHSRATACDLAARVSDDRSRVDALTELSCDVQQ